jgi:phosphoribosyl 1,2-cyclic phosphodiesterase
MSLFISSLNSGSNGNCYYIGNGQEAVLVDAGISCKEIEQRMQRLGLSLSKVKAIFVSHEHADHIKGVPVLAKKYRLPVYITEPTRIHGRVKLEKNQAIHFEADAPIPIGALSITAFSKHHDAADPYSFFIQYNGIQVGVFTDIGTPCDGLVQHFKNCHAAFLESNYDELMLDKGSYPYYLKSRIRDGKGHLSNRQALELFLAHRPSFMSHLLLSHLSRNNNNPQLVQQLFEAHANGVKMIIASRDCETEVYQIVADNMVRNAVQNITQRITALSSEQLSFSFE